MSPTQTVADSTLNLTVAGGEPLVWGRRTYVMGIINLTPDSFSGDGLAEDPSTAVELAQRMEAEGADFIDVGAESTRPGSAADFSRNGIGASASLPGRHLRGRQHPGQRRYLQSARGSARHRGRRVIGQRHLGMLGRRRHGAADRRRWRSGHLDAQPKPSAVR